MRQRPTLELLEPRILYSADTPSALAAALVGTPDAEHRLLDAEGEFAVQSAPQEIVFIDARTPDSAQLIEDIAAQSGRDIEIIVLDAERNGLEQISEALAGRENVAALHFIAHGGEGVIQLGDTLVTADSLESNPGLVESWSQVLTADADILLYGCDIAATAEGRLLADTLARLTGADVSASDDATGHASLGGDWTLEYATGVIDVQAVPSEEAQAAWLHLLNTVYVAYEPDFSEMPDEGYEISGGDPLEQTFTYNSGNGTFFVDSIDLVLYKNTDANPGGNVNVQVRDAGGAIASGTVSINTLGLAEAWVTVTLNAPVVLTDNLIYSIRISFGSGDVFVGVDDSGTYADGNFINSNGDAEPGKDMAFRLWNFGAPVVDLNAGDAGQNVAVAFTEQTPVLIAPVGTLTDADTAYLESLTLTLTARPDGDAVESLSLNATAAAAASSAGLTVTYTAATGVLLITDLDLGTPTDVATWQTILQGVQYDNTSDAPDTSDRFVTVVADDGVQTSLSRTSTITVTAVNDAPVLTPAAPAFSPITEDQLANAGDSVATLLGASVSDVDAGALEGIAITGLNSSNGTWEFSTDGGGSWSAVGAVSNVSALLLRDSDRLRFVPDGLNADAGTVTYRAWDRTSGTEGTKVDVSVNGGTTAFSSASDTASITVTALNDAPVLTPAAPAFSPITEDQLANAGDSVATLLGASVSDVDAGALEGIAITGLNSSNGTWQFSTDGGGSWSAVGAVSNVSALLLRDSDRLRFVPDGANADAGTVSYRAWDRTSGTEGTKVDVSVNGGTTAFSTASDTASITVTAVNDAPTNAMPGAQATDEDSALVFSSGSGNAISIADVDASANPVQVTLTGINGVITLSGTTGLSFSTGDGAADGTMTFSGTVSAINAALNGLSFLPDVNFNGAASLSINTNDLGNTGAGGALSDLDTVAITVNAVNDAPVNTVPGAQATNEDTALVLNTISIADVDAGASPVQVTLTGTNGVITLSGTTGLTFSMGDGSADGTMTFSGTVAAINAALNGLSFAPTADFNGAASLSINTNDLGNSGAGGALSDLDAVAITVNAMNDAPVNAVPGAQTANEDLALVFSSGNGNAISITDDAGTNPVQVSLSGTNGVITLSGTAGLTLSVGDGTADGTMTFSGTVSAINAALNGLSFLPNADFNGAASLSINTNDQGNTGFGGALSDLDAVAITVNAVNDAPVNTVPGAQTASEDTVFVFSTGNGNAISVADIDAGTSPLQVVLTGIDGAITLAGIAGLTFSVGDGVADSTMTFTGTAAAINAALNGLGFMPGADFTGVASLSISTNDQGNSGAGGAQSDSDAVTITVLANAAPTVITSGGTTVFTEGSNVASTPVAVDGALTVSDPDSVTLAAATISIGAGWQAAEDVLGFTGNPATMGNIAGSYNAATGVLSLNSAGASATLAQWQAALRSVSYTNTSDTPNTAARTVSFVVNGQGGTSAASSQQVAVTAMNDAPTLSASGGTTAFTGGGAPVVVDSALSVSDVDNATLANARIWFSGGFQPGQDVLGFSNDPLTMGNITGSYNAASGLLTLNSAGATATLAQWQAALRSVTYGNTSPTPIVGMRSVSFDVNDGTAYAVAAATHGVEVNAAPVTPDPVPPPVVVPPPVIPPVVGPPPVTPPPTTTPPPTQPAPAPSQPAAGVEEAPIQPVSVDIAERPHNPMAVVTTVGASNVGTGPALRLAVYGAAVQGVELAGGDLLGEVLRQADTRSNGPFQSGEKGRAAGEVELSEDLESLRETLREQDEIQSRGTVALAAGSLSMTLAYLLWLIRGGALVASALSALPAWRILDPLPVLSRVSDDEDEEETDEDDDQAIASFADEPVGARQ